MIFPTLVYLNSETTPFKLLDIYIYMYYTLYVYMYTYIYIPIDHPPIAKVYDLRNRWI